ncbi:MAG: CHAD domain-containing protein [Phycisphaeraceae bacterium]
MNPTSPAFAFLASQALAERYDALRCQIDRLVKLGQSESFPETSAAPGIGMEAVHQIRVAGRRLRIALRGFRGRGFSDALSAKKAKRWADDIRKLTRALGPVRDADVQLQFIDDYLAQHTPSPSSSSKPAPSGGAAWRFALKRLRLRITQQRQRQAARIDRAVARFQSSDLYRNPPQPLTSQPPDDDPALRDHADQAIAERTAQLLAFAPFADQPDRADELHQMRIAAKRLRYTMELYEPILPKKQRRKLAKVRTLQTLLGDLHDCDMWIALLPAFLESERQRMIEYQGHQRGFKRLASGIEHLLGDRRAARAVHYQAFHGYWHRLLDNDTFKLSDSSALQAEAERTSGGAASGSPPTDPPTSPNNPK